LLSVAGMTAHYLRSSGIVILLFSIAAAACGDSPTSPSTTSTTPALSQLLSGTVSVGGTDASATFTLTAALTVNVTLVGLTRPSNGLPLTNTVRLGLGSWDGTTCTPISSVSAAPALTAHLSVALGTGTYCASVTDTGGLPEASTYAIRVLGWSGAPPTSTSSTTDSFSTALAVGGTSGRTFVANGAGTVTVNLTSGGSDTQPLGLGLGWWDGATCRVSVEVLANPGADPQITTSVDAATYCVRLRDPGGFSGQIDFYVNIVHP
jgi:hypothetical protein